MSTDLLISSDPWENRVAILEDGNLNEFYIEREERVIGSIYKGKVQNVLPGMGASFIDIGLGRNAFLYVDDINKTPLNIGDVEITQGRTGWTINEKVAKGDDVLVQIVKEPRGLKGARVSTNISLPGRYLILMPTGRFSGVSRKIESADERNRLKTIMKAIRPEGMATVVRTAAGGVSNAELIADLGVLIRMWHGILEGYKSAPTPSLLHKDMNLVFKAARDFITPEVANVWIDDAEECERVREFMRLLGPQYVERIKPYPGGRKLFGDFKIDDEIAKLMKPTVKLPSGGSIVIESTEALTVVDVNSGKFTGGKNLDDTIVRTNVEAATEIARQVRLRDIGGIIVCDFIDMSSEGDRNRVVKALEDGLRKDRTRSTIQSFSPLGLLEFTRKRVGKDLAGQLRSSCPTCAGLGSVMSPESVTISTFRHILEHRNGHAEAIHVAAPPQVAAQMDFWYEDELHELSERIGAPIEVRVDPALHPERPLVRRGNGVPELAPIRVGDEVEVDVLPVRLPIATNAVAVVKGRLVEIENAAAAVGQAIKIRIIDVDGADVLAEPRTPVAEQAAERRKRRKRGGRGRKPLTAAEQQEELRELAEEAAKGLGARPAVIGISTAEEAAAEDQITKHASVPQHAALSEAAEQRPSEAATEPLPPRRDRGGRRDRPERPERGERPAVADRFVVPPAAPPAGRATFAPLPGESLSGALAVRLPGEVLSGDRIGATAAAAAPVPLPVAAIAAPEGIDAEETSDTGTRRRRRRRRRRGGANGNGAAGAGEAATAPDQVPLAHVDLDTDPEDDDEISEPLVAAEGAPSGFPVELGPDGEPRRRRRRRRRRRGGAGRDGMLGTGEALPERQIIRVDGTGTAHPTGEIAPPQPSRAIAPFTEPSRQVAIEPPPPVLTAPTVPEPKLPVAAPARRRRAQPGRRDPVAPIEAVPVKALPAPEPEPAAAPVAPRRRTAAVKKVASAKKALAAKKTAAKKAVAKKAVAKKAPAVRATAKKAPAKKAPAVKKTAAKRATAKKSTARKK